MLLLLLLYFINISINQLDDKPVLTFFRFSVVLPMLSRVGMARLKVCLRVYSRTPALSCCNHSN